VLLVDEALTELVLVLVESELPVPSAPDGGGGGCCSDASSSSSALDNWAELSLLLTDDALLSVDEALTELVLALVESELPVASDCCCC